MTEAEWLACSTPELMMTFLRQYQVCEVQGTTTWVRLSGDTGYPGDRKKRLYSCACCRRIWHLLSPKYGRPAIEIAERFANGLASAEDRAHGFSLAVKGRSMAPIGKWSDAMHAAAAAVSPAQLEWSTSVGWFDWGACHRSVHSAETGSYEPGQSPTNRDHANLLRHIVGNPFRPFSAPKHLPATVTDLAAALYDGGDCAFALHDALLEAGHVELAEHFREREHPKGCWALDLILGKA